MKKIFSIIAASLCGLVVAFIVTLSFVRTNIPISFRDPYQIYVFNQSTTATVANGYQKKDKQFDEVMKQVKRLSSISIFTRLVNGTAVKPQIEQNIEGTFSKWSTDIKQHNIVIELVYDRQLDMVVHVGEDTRVISYYCLSFVIPMNEKFSDIIIYYSDTTSSEAKNESYAECEPLVVKGMAKKMIKFVDSL